jgi:integrase
MSLTEIKIKSAKIKDKNYKLSDGEGLYLLVNPNGSKYWRLKYRFGGKEKVYSIGIYPKVSLAEAREERFKIKKKIKDGYNPNDQKKTTILEEKIKAGHNFESVAFEWHSKNLNKWTPRHAKKLKTWIEKDISPFIGQRLISEVKPMHILEIMRKIEDRKAYDVTRGVLSLCSQIFRYGIPNGMCEYDVTVGINKALVFIKRKNFNCINTSEFPKLLKDIEKHTCSFLTKYALKLIILTFVRTGELRFAKWSEIDFDKKEWRIPAERMKMREQHIVPLARQAVEILEGIKSLQLKSDYVFPNENNPNKVMSENTMLFGLYDMGYSNKMTVHGFRQIASTILNENSFNRDAIERQLSHAERNNIRRAYNHAQYLPERREMMQWWADYIDDISK